MHFISHTGQDRWVADVFKFKKAGYFLDFGGFDGLMHSNTFYLEKFLSWNGILVEPNPRPYISACAVRSCITVNNALWNESRKSVEFTDSHGLSSFVSFIDSDENSGLRREISKGTIKVDTIDPTELLDRFSAPEFIDFMSLDVEGAEFEVLKAIDLNKYKIALMSIEHNHQEKKRNSVREYLSNLGYLAIAHRNDDFFYHPVYLEQIAGKSGFADPEDVQREVINSYKLVEY